MHAEATGWAVKQGCADVVRIVPRAIQQAVRLVGMAPERQRPLACAGVGAAGQSTVDADSGPAATAKIDQLESVVMGQQAARALLEFRALDEGNSRIAQEGFYEGSARCLAKVQNAIFAARRIESVSGWLSLRRAKKDRRVFGSVNPPPWPRLRDLRNR
jgi:hypothetical protein